MVRISARGTRLVKLGIPALFIGFTAYAALAGLGPDHEHPGYLWPLVLFMVAVMVLFERHVLRDLADEVLDGGDFLVVSHRGSRFTVPLADVDRVDWISDRPGRIAIRYRTPQGPRTFLFTPAESSFWPFPEESKIAADLEKRIAITPVASRPATPANG